jgi:3-hydroxyisobutyrate dehydrogenase-like beta-hydroxyacid dehydrogenase
MAPRLLWIGLGNMGRVRMTVVKVVSLICAKSCQSKGMCKNLVEKGNLDQPLMLFNRSTARAEELSKKLEAGKTEVVTSLADGAAKADVIFICLANDTAVTEAIESISQSDLKGKLVVDCSTIHPDTTELVAKAVVGKGADFVAAPVFGAPAMADAGQLIGVLAGPEASVDKARPFFKGVTSRAEILMADEPYRHSTLLKVIGNTFVLAMVEQLAEGHVLAEKSGLGTAHLHSLMELLFPGPYAAYSNRMLGGDYYKREEPLFAVDLARKDAGHAKKLAEEAGTRLKIAEVADSHLAKVKEHSGPKGDIAGIYGAVRQEAGLKFENDS